MHVSILCMQLITTIRFPKEKAPFPYFSNIHIFTFTHKYKKKGSSLAFSGKMEDDRTGKGKETKPNQQSKES